ncbi:MAG: hypothetical protein II956_15515 [Bacteroidales bacterium]|nr:hypothetical protein [Bacteroidales bacterium]
MKKILFPLFLLFFSLGVDAQKQRDFSKYEHKHAFHKPWIGNNKFLTDYMDKIGYENQTLPLYSVPVKFYVFGKNNAPDIQDVKETVQNLNALYAENNTLISFYVSDVKFIRKKKFDKFGYYVQFPFQSFLRHDRKALNVFLVSKLTKPGKKNKNLEYTGVCNNVNHTVVVSSKNDASVIAHEVGHYFLLKHPHKNYDKGKRRQEAVDRDVFRGGLFVRGRNSEICGDGLSDTYAQPHLIKNTDRNCNYLSPELTDIRGKKYTPQVDNIMSYTMGKQCRRRFTKMQKAVMLYTVSKKKNADLWQLKSTFADKFEPDFSPLTATVLKDKILQEHNFHKTVFKKNKIEDEDVDFMRFTIGKKVNVENSRIVISGQAALKAEIFVSENDELKSLKEISKNKDERTEISLQGFVTGSYVIKISQTQKTSENNVTVSYSITLDLDKGENNIIKKE